MKSLFIAYAAWYLLSPIAHAVENKQWHPCVEMKDQAPVAQELDCYRRAAASEANDNETSKPLLSARGTGLEKEWAPNDATLVTHKLNYTLIYSKTSKTNALPYSPNPNNQVLTALPPDDRDMKIQFSMKHNIGDFDRLGSLWVGYTLLSFWQVYDEAHSRPFRENNYEPELIYSTYPDALFGKSRFNPDILNFGVVHQSNGQPEPRSRSWNRFYVQTGIEQNYAGDRKFIALVRAWKRIAESSSNDDNPDITQYLGRGEVELRYSQNKNWEATIVLKGRSTQLDLSAPWTAYRLLALAAPGEHNTNIHLQYFSGYGESLIDYNHRHETWGLGVSFPFE
jgi:phospholipase A1